MTDFYFLETLKSALGSSIIHYSVSVYQEVVFSRLLHNVRRGFGSHRWRQYKGGGWCANNQIECSINS